MGKADYGCLKNNQIELYGHGNFSPVQLGLLLVTADTMSCSFSVFTKSK